MLRQRSLEEMKDDFTHNITHELKDTRIAVNDDEIYFRVNIDGRKTYFSWSDNGQDFHQIGSVFDTTKSLREPYTHWHITCRACQINFNTI